MKILYFFVNITILYKHVLNEAIKSNNNNNNNKSIAPDVTHQPSSTIPKRQQPPVTTTTTSADPVLDQFQQMRSMISTFLGVHQDPTPSPQ